SARASTSSRATTAPPSARRPGALTCRDDQRRISRLSNPFDGNGSDLLMNGARPCPSCGTEVPPDFKFCGKCGSRVDANVMSGSAAPAGGGGLGAKTMFFGATQVPNRAKLIVIKGEGVDGVSYQLAGVEHVAGRLDGAILFPDDPLMSPRHANFIYKD